MSFGQLQDGTRRFAQEILRVSERLPRERTSERIGQELHRAAVALDARQEPSSTGQSADPADLCIIMDAAETLIFWLERLEEAHVTPLRVTAPLLAEAHRLLATLGAALD